MYEHITFLPQNYEQTNNSYPLLFFLHDKEQQGFDFDAIRNIGIPKLINNKELELDMITIAPQAPTDESWKTNKLIDLLAKVNIQYRIDTNKIYFVGIGVGGYGALKFATIYKDIPSAIISVAGGGNENMAFYLQKTPVWLIHGTDDKIIPFYKTKALADALEINTKLKLTILKNKGHEIVDTVFKNNELYEWLLKSEK